MVLTDYKFALDLAMIWCHTDEQSKTKPGIWNILLYNSLRPRQNGRHFPMHFFNEDVWISRKISLKFVPGVRINNIRPLVQIMAWRRPATSHYVNQWWLVYWRIYASYGLSESTISITSMTNEVNSSAQWNDYTFFFTYTKEYTKELINFWPVPFCLGDPANFCHWLASCMSQSVLSSMQD